jgi:hypothetical protein
MRTTLVIEDEVFAEARVRAAQEGRTLSELVSLSLRESFRRKKTPGTVAAFVMPVFGVEGTPVSRSVEELAGLRDEGR